MSNLHTYLPQDLLRAVALGADAFNAAWEAGQQMTMEQAIDQALTPGEGT